jgi:vacuolar-type H+-ATPase subunit H
MPDTVLPAGAGRDTGRDTALDGDIDIERAFARVLHAEGEARRAIEAARDEAAVIAEGARAGARRVAERAEARIARGHAAVQRQLAAALSNIEAGARALPGLDEPDDAALARLEAALHRLAAELTGASAPPAA